MSVTSEVEVGLEPARAFELFVEGLGRWWPAEYTWSQDVLEEIGIEARLGGLCFERGPHDFRCHWGRVIELDPPERVVFTWQISPRREPVPDPGKASEVEVRFEPAGGGTVVRFEHRGFERHGDGAEGYEAAMGSPQGWDYILGRYSEAAREVG